jgi:hypothetical protein
MISVDSPIIVVAEDDAPDVTVRVTVWRSLAVEIDVGT